VREIIRRCTAALLALAGVLTLVSCEPGPSRVGAAAVVGETRIPLDVVQSEFRWLLKNIPQAKQLKDDNQLEFISRYSLQVRIRHELIKAAAKELHLTADPAEVDRLIKNAGGEAKAPQSLLVSPGQARQFIEDIVLLRAIGRHYVDRLKIKVVGAFVADEAPGATSRAKAMELGRKIAAEPERAEELAATGEQPISGELELSRVVGSGDATLARTPLFAVKPGTVVVTQPDPEQGAVWLVALVQERKEVAISPVEAVKEYPTEVLEQVGLQMLRPYAERLGVTVSPRFGVWDQAGMTILDNAGESRGLLLTARGADQQ